MKGGEDILHHRSDFMDFFKTDSFSHFIYCLNTFAITFNSLARLVRSRTYLDWPEDEADRVHFWDRLRRNIAEEDMNDTEVEKILHLV